MMSLANVVRFGPTVGVEPEAMAGWDVAVGIGGFVGSEGASVGMSTSVAIGEQAASPLRTPSAPIFIASLREIFLFIVTPLKLTIKGNVEI